MGRPWKAIIVIGDRHAQDTLHLEATWWEAVFHTLRHHTNGYTDNVLIHGACRGIDKIAEQVVEDDLKHQFQATLAHEVSDETWQRLGRMAGPLRNAAMLRTLMDIRESGDCAAEVIAFHNDIASSKGTRNMVAQAREAGVPVFVYNEEGSLYER